MYAYVTYRGLVSTALQHWREPVREGVEDLCDGRMLRTSQQLTVSGITCTERPIHDSCLMDDVALPDDCRRCTLSYVHLSYCKGFAIDQGREQTTAREPHPARRQV